LWEGGGKYSDSGFCIIAGDAGEFTDLFYLPCFNFFFVFGSHEAGWEGTAGQALQNGGVVVMVMVMVMMFAARIGQMIDRSKAGMDANPGIG